MKNVHQDPLGFSEEIARRRVKGENFPIEEFRPALDKVLKDLKTAVERAQAGNDPDSFEQWKITGGMNRDSNIVAVRISAYQKAGFDLPCMTQTLAEAEMIQKSLIQYIDFWVTVRKIQWAVSGCRNIHQHKLKDIPEGYFGDFRNPGLIFIPTIGEETMESFLNLRTSPVHLMGLAPQTTAADGLLWSPFEFLGHDSGHTFLMVLADTKTCSFSLETGWTLEQSIRCFRDLSPSTDRLMELVSGTEKRPGYINLLFKRTHERGKSMFPPSFLADSKLNDPNFAPGEFREKLELQCKKKGVAFEDFQKIVNSQKSQIGPGEEERLAELQSEAELFCQALYASVVVPATYQSKRSN